MPSLLRYLRPKCGKCYQRLLRLSCMPSEIFRIAGFPRKKWHRFFSSELSHFQLPNSESYWILRKAVKTSDVTKFAWVFDNVRTSNVSADSKFVEFFHVPVVEFEPQVYTIGITCLHPLATGTTN